MKKALEKSIEARIEKRENNKIDFLEALEKSAGNISIACKQINVGRSTFYKWMEDQDFAIAVKHIEESMIDLAETALYKQIREGNTSAIIFYLKCKGKKRGYAEKLEIGTEDDNRIKIEIVDVRTPN